MNVSINRKSVEVKTSASIAELLAQQRIATEGIAVARNDRVVPRSCWETTTLEPDDRITVIRAVCGG